MTKKLITIICLLLLFTIPVFSQNEEVPEDDYIGIVAFTKGEQVFAINAGPIFPLFTYAPSFTDVGPSASALSSVKVGITGSLKLGFFVLDNFMIGGELAGMFAATENRTLTMIPLTFFASYYFIKYPFEFPLYMNVGISMNRLDDFFKVTPIFKPGAGAYWNFNGEWAIGLNTEYWFMPEFYFSEDYKNESRIANFLQLSLSAVYHF